MDSAKRAKLRLGMYPQLLGKCGETASVYAKCVVIKEAKVSKDDCLQEFQQLKNCMMQAAKQMKTRL